MGYLHIKNLSAKDNDILSFSRCYALEKIHGTSSHAAWNKGKLTFFAGGEKHDNFVKLFDQEKLIAHFTALGQDNVTIFGEAYGGKQQGMKNTYGPELRFIAFDVRVGDTWLAVPEAAKIVEDFGLEFVPYREISTDMAELDFERDCPSEVAVRRGMGADKKREGVVLRPLKETVNKHGERLIQKHKGAAFQERSNPPKTLDPDKMQILQEADAIAEEWVVPNRLDHVIQALQSAGGFAGDVADIPKVIAAMMEDVYREAAGEFVESKEARTAIGKMTVKLYKQWMNNQLKEGER